MSLDVVVYRAGTRWATPWEDVFIQGLRAHGIEPEQRPQTDRRVSDLAVIWAHRQRPLFEMQRQAGKPYLIMERGYIGDRHYWTSLGFNGLNGNATFPPPVEGRFDRFFTLKRWQSGGEYALLIGQVPGDASVKHLDIDKWAADQVMRLKGMEVVYRPHPLNTSSVKLTGAKLSRGYLADDLAGAAFVLTYNSNTAVESVLSGVSAIAMDRGSMAWSVTSHDLDEPLWCGDRAKWANQVASSQWSADEISTGRAWEQLKKCL